MPETDLIPEPWGAFLRDLDEIATEPVDFYCIGGFVITRKYGFQRETNDLDVLVLRLTHSGRSSCKRAQRAPNYI
jgi:hypothetical protein